MADATPIPNAGFMALLGMAEFGACLVDPQGWRILYANPAMMRAVGKDGGEADGSLLDWLPELTVPKNMELLEAVAAGQLSGMTIASHLAGGETAATIRSVEIESEILLAVVVQPAAASIDGCGGREGFDSLTGLSDRGRLMDRLTRLVQGVRSGDQRCAVLFLDLDGFKQVNDIHGHLVGDGVLREVARRLTGCVRGGDLVARFGGDEFVVLLERVATINEVAPVLCRLKAAFEQPFSIAEGAVHLGVSVGVAQAGVDGTTAEELIRAADRAMYAVKRKLG